MPPSSRAKSVLARDATDRRLSRVGLARGPRKKSSPPIRKPRPNIRFDRADFEEGITPPPVPHRGANGVEWLPVPGWDLPWLWAGFSMRKGGLSRAYCPESSGNVAAAGELNLGFTAPPDREIDRDTVIRNPRLLRSQ